MKLFDVAMQLDRIGFRRPIAMVASWANPLHAYSVDRTGHWVNRQGDIAFVSPEIHTIPVETVRATVLDNWCRFYTPADGDVVVDIGAGIGEESLIFSQLVGPTGTVIAIEAHPVTYACLDSSIELSNRSNIVPCPVAITDSDGEISISTTSNHLENSVITGAGDTRVLTRSLDSLAREHKLERIDFLKMNIEGAEKLALRGMTEIAPRIRNLCISCHDFVADSTGDEAMRSKQEVLAWIKANGFTLHEWQAPADKPWQRDFVFASLSA